jgi:phage gp29-like protein
MDSLEIFDQKGGGDPHQIYGSLIDKCDAAISKTILSQTGTTDEKAYSGSAKVHGDTEADIIFSDKLDIEAVVNKELIPRMQKIGMIDANKKITGGWDFSEKSTSQEWAQTILTLSQAGFAVSPEEVEKRTGIKVDETIVALPDNKTFSVMNKVSKLYGKND